MKNFGIEKSTHSHRSIVIRGHFFNVICGHRPANLDCRISSGNDNVERVIDHKKKTNITFKGLDVVRQYAVLFERRVQSSTRVRKAQVVTRQTNPIGRSMIEMLGVLAIIGVLSVGGIAGYSKAMQQYKVNKLKTQTEDLIFNIKDAYKNEKTYGQPNEDLLPVLKSINVVPMDMLDDNNNDLFGNKVSVFMYTWSSYTRMGIKYEMPPNSTSVQNCREMFHLLPALTDSVWTIVNCQGFGCHENWLYRICGKARPPEYTACEKRPEDYNLSEVSAACKICQDDYCSILILFDNNV